MSAGRLGRMVTILLVAGGLSSCGIVHRGDEKPPAEARQAIVGFLVALEQGRTAAACTALQPDTISTLRTDVLGAVRVKPGTEAARLRQVKAARRQAATCAGMLRLLGHEARAKLPAATARARALPMTWIGPASAKTVSLGDQDWVVQCLDDRWLVVSVNALPIAA